MTKIYLKYNFSETCKAIVTEQLNLLGLTYKLHGTGEIEFVEKLNSAHQSNLTNALSKYGITIVDNQKNELVQRIKDAITELIYNQEEENLYKVSAYLSEKLEYSYSYLSTVFSETTYSSIENFIILKKIDYAKELIISNNLTLTEIAFQLNYSSVAHLSYQFKKTTGLTPSAFQKIIEKRKVNNIISL